MVPIYIYFKINIFISCINEETNYTHTYTHQQKRKKKKIGYENTADNRIVKNASFEDYNIIYEARKNSFKRLEVNINGYRLNSFSLL